jgi:hypothetical protein
VLVNCNQRTSGDEHFGQVGSVDGRVTIETTVLGSPYCAVPNPPGLSSRLRSAFYGAITDSPLDEPDARARARPLHGAEDAAADEALSAMPE